MSVLLSLEKLPVIVASKTYVVSFRNTKSKNISVTRVRMIEIFFPKRIERSDRIYSIYFYYSPVNRVYYYAALANRLVKYTLAV